MCLLQPACFAVEDANVAAMKPMMELVVVIHLL
jgi:hypothetical protein